MHLGQYVFTQIASFLPKRYFERLAAKSNDRTKKWTPSHWSQLLVLMFGQFMGCRGLRELTDITTAHVKKSFHLGFGKTPINKSTLSKANTLSAYDILGQISNHTYRVDAQGRTETWTNTIPRYAMLSISWRFNKNPKKRE